MAYADFLGNQIDTKTDADARAIDDFVDGMLSYETRAVNVIKVADRAPENTLANVYAAMLHMFAETPSAASNATPYIARARASALTASPRVQMALTLVEAWAKDDIPRAEAIGAALNEAFPRDLLITKLRQYFAFNRGDFPAMLAAAESVARVNADVAQWHGMLAFGYEQCDRLDIAEAAARRALALKAKEPWAHHALAHVMLTQGRIDEGARFLESVRHTWVDLNSFMLTHNYWHLGLFYMSQGRFGDARALYDDFIWGADKEYSQDQIGAVSYLARLEFAGADVGDRWQELGAYLAARADDVVQPFLSLQYLYGLARAQRSEAATLFAAIEHAAKEAPPHSRDAWALAAFPAARGIIAHARGAYADSVAHFDTALPHLMSIGGSHAQRDLFEQLHLDALVRAGAHARAIAKLEGRRRFDPEGVPLNTLLAQQYRALGQESEATTAEARATATRIKHTH